MNDIVKRIQEEHPLSGEYADDARYTWPERWDALVDALAAKEAELASLQKTAEGISHQCTILNGKLALYRKAVGPVKEADDELLFVMITDKEIPEAEQKRIAGMCVKAVRDCIRILGEAGMNDSPKATESVMEGGDG